MIAFFRWLLRILFGLRADNLSVLRTPGPVLLIPNHVSWLDWLLVGVWLEPDWRFVVSRISAQRSWLHRRIMLNRRTFPIDNLSPFAAKRMAEYLAKGGRLVLFAEGRLSRTGSLMKLFEGTGFLLHKTSAKVITCYLRGAHRLIRSPNPDRKRWLPRVSAHFSPVLTPPSMQHLSGSQARLRLTAWLREAMVRQQFEIEMQQGVATVPEAIVQTARRALGRVILEDINGSLTYRRFLAGAELLAEQLDKKLLRQTPRVGVLLPNVNATPVMLLSLWALNRVPAVLNFTTGPATMAACAQLAGLRQVVTSRAFLERAKLDLGVLTTAGVEAIYLEDLREEIGRLSKLRALLHLSLRPSAVLRRREPSSTHAGEQPAVVLFTSGSEGVPKGVELTQRNLLSNLRQILAVCDLQDRDRVFNALPLFHSFGLTVGTLLPLVRGFECLLFPSPLQYRVVPTIFYERDCTILLGTNTFLNGYARKAHPMDFRSLRYLFAGAEKLQEATATTWAQRFGVRVLEGYGATECSPVISACTPLVPRHGSAGQFMPGMEYRLEPVEGVTTGGRLLVRGPNVMRGYLNPEANAKFQALGGWYDTGDIVRVDEEGFVFIQGRLKRFAKISGEMVSLTAVEEALAAAFPKYGLRCQVAVIARPDADKGELLIAVSNEPKLTVDEVRMALRAKGLPNICVPREVRFLHELPRLGTGKINHRELEKLA